MLPNRVDSLVDKFASGHLTVIDITKHSAARQPVEPMGCYLCIFCG
jgi:hypothetical protein